MLGMQPSVVVGSREASQMGNAGSDLFVEGVNEGKP